MHFQIYTPTWKLGNMLTADSEKTDFINIHILSQNTIEAKGKLEITICTINNKEPPVKNITT